MSFTIPLPTYERREQVQALKIKAVVPNPRGWELHFDDDRFVPILVSDAWVLNHAPQEGGYAGGYFVVYEDGYQSYSPAAAFEAGYTLVPEDAERGGA